MKNLIRLTLLCSLFSLTYCEKPNASEIPDVVKEGFVKKYPNATDIHWGMEDGEYEAEFKINGEEKEAHFNDQGKFVKEE